MFVEFIPNHNGILNYTYGETKIEAGKHYIMHDSWIGKIPGSLILLEHTFKQYDIKIDSNNKKILIMRTMGAGDMLMVSGLIKYIKSKYPSCQIDFACIKEQHEVAKMLDGVSDVIALPIDAEKFHDYDFHFSVAGLIEGNKDNERRNIYDVFFEHLGVEMSPNGVAKCDEKFKRPYIKPNLYTNILKNNNLIGIHCFAHDPIRQLNPGVVKLVINKLLELNKEVLVFGSVKEIAACKDYFGHNVKYSNGSYTDVIKQVAQCSHILCDDSMILHMAQAIGIKTTVIFGPFSSDTRVKYYGNINVIDTNPDCQCFLHNVGKCPKIERVGPSLCLNVDPLIIINTIFDEEIPIYKPKHPQVTVYNISKEF